VSFRTAASETEEILRGQLARSQAEWLAASSQLDLMVHESPGGIPQSDGSLRIRQAGQVLREAGAKYRRALRRFSEFTLQGKVPDDLRPPD
jgi:hypothetical protein